MNYFLVKVCDKHHIIREKKQQYVKIEKEVLRILSLNVKTSAPFFVRLFCTFHDEQSLCEYMTMCSASEFLVVIIFFVFYPH